MPTYLYCVRSRPIGPPAGLIGIDGAGVRPIDANGLRAWVSDVEGAVAATVDRVRAHDAVCAAALDGNDTPLPIRFGQTFDDDAAAAAAVVSRERALRSRLQRIDGCVEMRIVVSQGRPTRAEDDRVVGPGTAFLQRLAHEGRADLAREVGCEEIRHALRTVAPSLIVDHQPCESARGLSFFPVLVRRTSLDAFRRAMIDMMSRDNIDLSVLGPFAPYSFAGDA
jgi:hypothetical protein